MLSKEQVASYHKNGYLVVRDLLAETEVKDLQGWAQEVHDWEPTADSQFMPYEVRSTLEDDIGYVGQAGNLLTWLISRK